MRVLQRPVESATESRHSSQRLASCYRIGGYFDVVTSGYFAVVVGGGFSWNTHPAMIQLAWAVSPLRQNQKLVWRYLLVNQQQEFFWQVQLQKCLNQPKHYSN